MEGKARVLGLLLSYVVLLKTLFPLRLGSTLLLTPQMQRLLSGGGSVLGELGLSAPGRGGTRALKSELLDLAARSRGGLVALGAEEQARFDQIVDELRELNAVDRPARGSSIRPCEAVPRVAATGRPTGFAKRSDFAADLTRENSSRR